ncbi:PAS domain-containing protein [Belnapia sp. T18]|uniref:histidine kinase n=1 Tax=Belnapia arida TaxID=2804533 RepID=A0ABS1U6A3_9PROT|nr:PAS domain-containing protein [Belnapia arida]MBL6080202.1 PAS domain-containing protein [Belnapia arida]
MSRSTLSGPGGENGFRASAWLFACLLAAAIGLPAVLLGAGGWLAWKGAWREARNEVAREADAGADYASRLLLNYGIAASRLDDLLQGLSDAEITAQAESLRPAARALTTELPQFGHAAVFDRQGTVLLVTNGHPLPPGGAGFDDGFLAAMRAPGAPPLHLGEVFASPQDGKLIFTVGRQRTRTGNPSPTDGFDGLVKLAVEPEVVAEGLRRLRATPSDLIGLLRSDGRVLARTDGFTAPLPPLPTRTPFHAVAAAGAERALIADDAMLDRKPALIGLRRLDGFPAYAAAIRTRAAIIAAWREAMLPQLAIALPAMLALLGLAALVWRGQRRLIAAHDRLETRVAERTAALAEVSEALDLTPCVITDLDGRIIHWSEGCVRLYGYGREEALGRMVAALLRTEFQAGGREGLLANLLREGQWQGEVRQYRRDGSLIVTGTQWTLRREPRTGAPHSIVSTRADLSALHQAEHALRRSEARLQRAQEASGAVAFELAEDGSVLADAAMPGLFGLAPTGPLTLARLASRLHAEDCRLLAGTYRGLARHGGAFNLEFRIRRPDGSVRWLLARGEAQPRQPGRFAPRLAAGIILDVTERHHAEAALAASGERLRLAQEAAGFGIYDHDFRTGAVTWDSRMRAFWDLPEDEPVTSRHFLAGLHPGDRPLRRDAMRRAKDPHGTGTYQAEFRVVAGPAQDERWIFTIGQVHFERDRPVRLTGLALDITERKRSEQRNELLMREVDHRAKNALAVVQAALRLSRAETPAELVRIIEGRVSALARAQTILARRRWEGAELHALLEGELAAFLTGIRLDAPRAELHGPPVTIAAHAAQPLSMAVHELATNAMKYGALSRRGGLLQVSWRLDPLQRVLTLLWRERGGPEEAANPVRRGFGSRVIEQTVQVQLGGRVTRRWLPGGLACEIAIPLARQEVAEAVAVEKAVAA